MRLNPNQPKRVIKVTRYIDINFAMRDDCLDNMVPSDLRMLVSERDELLEQRDKMLLITKSTLCPDCQTSGEFSVGGGYLAGCKFCSGRADLINEIEQSKQTTEGDIDG
jgi:hypothetical protein